MHSFLFYQCLTSKMGEGITARRQSACIDQKLFVQYRVTVDRDKFLHVILTLIASNWN